MVRDVFCLAKENAPAIIFIDEIDAIATARFDAQTGADREVQRKPMELLNQVFALLCVRPEWSFNFVVFMLVSKTSKLREP